MGVMISAEKTILICRCTGHGLLEKSGEVLSLAASAQAAAVEDLCQAAMENDPVLKEIASADAPVIYACHPRAVKALFEFAGCPLPATARLINLRTHPRTPALPPSGTPPAPAWYPVLDMARCTGCGQCLEFCLFGVYEKDAQGTLRVANPQNCKNNCPACARICPAAAIIFPKAGESPINGAEISDEEALKANIKINVDELLGGDVYAALNARRQKRRALLNRKKVEQALAERDQCSEKSA